MICLLFIAISVQKSLQICKPAFACWKMQNHCVAVINFFFCFHLIKFVQRMRKGFYHPQEKQVSHTWLPSFWVTTSLGLRQAQWQIINFHGYNLGSQMFVEGESGKNGINVLVLIKNKLQVCFHAASVILWIKCKCYKIHKSSCVTDGNVDTTVCIFYTLEVSSYCKETK